jgi:hypothetical protein
LCIASFGPRNRSAFRSAAAALVNLAAEEACLRPVAASWRRFACVAVTLGGLVILRACAVAALERACEASSFAKEVPKNSARASGSAFRLWGWLAWLAPLASLGSPIVEIPTRNTKALVTL